MKEGPVSAVCGYWKRGRRLGAGRAGLAQRFWWWFYGQGHALPPGKIHTCPGELVTFWLMASRWKRRSEAPQARMAVSPWTLCVWLSASCTSVLCTCWVPSCLSFAVSPRCLGRLQSGAYCVGTDRKAKNFEDFGPHQARPKGAAHDAHPWHQLDRKGNNNMIMPAARSSALPPSAPLSQHCTSASTTARDDSRPQGLKEKTVSAGHTVESAERERIIRTDSTGPTRRACRWWPPCCTSIANNCPLGPAPANRRPRARAACFTRFALSRA
jgi:hypothetical protein